MSADAVMAMGVVIERRESGSPWQDFTWRPVAVIANAATASWREFRRGEGWVQFHAATLPLELFKGETEGYLANLAQEPPKVFAVLRPGDSADELEPEPFHLTVCPYEAMGYGESGDEIVEGVAMPDEVIAWLQAFVQAHHVEVPFKKRRNRRHASAAAGTRPRGRRSGAG